MTEEQRFDRLERIVKLMIKAGLRARKQGREQNEKINILIDSQISYEERVRRNEGEIKDYSERSNQHEERMRQYEERLAALAVVTDEKFAAMAAAQAGAEEQLKSLAATVERIITERGNGKP